MKEEQRADCWWQEIKQYSHDKSAI